LLSWWNPGEDGVKGDGEEADGEGDAEDW